MATIDNGEALEQGRRLVIISGPSGAGKSTVVQRLVATSPIPIRLSVSATTRAPRSGEREGESYYFLTDQEFQRRRSAGEFLECKQVFGRYWYGTLWSELTTGRKAAQWVLLEIDVEGALAVVGQLPRAKTIFLHPDSLEELERRLRGRKSESEQAIRGRLETARREMDARHHYRHEVINADVDQAVRDIVQILQSEGD